MKLITIFIAILYTFCDAKIQLSKQSYIKFPYQFVNGDPANARYGLLQNAAHKASYHTVDKILYVACELSIKMCLT